MKKKKRVGEQQLLAGAWCWAVGMPGAGWEPPRSWRNISLLWTNAKGLWAAVGSSSHPTPQIAAVPPQTSDRGLKGKSLHCCQP